MPWDEILICLKYSFLLYLRSLRLYEKLWLIHLSCVFISLVWTLLCRLYTKGIWYDNLHMHMSYYIGVKYNFTLVFCFLSWNTNTIFRYLEQPIREVYPTYNKSRHGDLQFKMFHSALIYTCTHSEESGPANWRLVGWNMCNKSWNIIY